MKFLDKFKNYESIYATLVGLIPTLYFALISPFNILPEYISSYWMILVIVLCSLIIWYKEVKYSILEKDIKNIGNKNNRYKVIALDLNNNRILIKAEDISSLAINCLLTIYYIENGFETYWSTVMVDNIQYNNNIIQGKICYKNCDNNIVCENITRENIIVKPVFLQNTLEIILRGEQS